MKSTIFEQTITMGLIRIVSIYRHCTIGANQAFRNQKGLSSMYVIYSEKGSLRNGYIGRGGTSRSSRF